MAEMSNFARIIMERTYAHDTEEGLEAWEQIAYRTTKHVMKAVGVDMRQQLAKEIYKSIAERKFIPGGRYLYAAGRQYHQVNNCLLLKVHDSREGWSELLAKASMALMSGAGIGVDYSDIRHEGASIRKTGGVATGPISLMQILNECGRGIMQGGNRRCLPDDTLITMHDFSKKKISAIQVGDRVLTRFGARPVSNMFDQGVQEILEIETEHGVVRCSRNHRWLCDGGVRRKTFYVPAEKLSLASKLYYHPVPKINGKPLDKKWCYVLGYFLGDGCAYSSGRTHEVTFQVAKPKYNQKQVKFISTVMAELGCNPITRRGHGEVTEIRCHSQKLVQEFQKYKQPNKPFVIPKEIWDADFDSRCAFIAGWFDADGCYTDSWKLANKWESVRREIRSFLTTLGFISTDNAGATGEVRLCNYQRAAWRQYITNRFSFKRPQGRSREKSSSEMPSKILAIRSIGKQHTYDIEVETDHEFIADDFVSHNSAIWAGLRWNHPDVHKFIRVKNWPDEIHQLKARDFSFPAMLDCTNISVQLDEAFFEAYHDDEHPQHALAHSVYWAAVEQMLKTGEPGLTVDVGKNSGETLRNACGEIASRDTDDICNLGSINIARVETLDEFKQMVSLAAAFLLAGTIYSDVPYSDVDKIRSKNRRLGIGIMGIHEWLLKRGKPYAPDEELGTWLAAYAKSGRAANKLADEWQLSRPKKTRAIAPNGTTGIVAETTGGIEPIPYVAYKRRYLKGDHQCYQYVIDPVARRLIEGGIDPAQIEDSYRLARDVERRVAFQAWVQGYVDHCISSTINLPAYGSELNNKDTIRSFGSMLLRYLPQLRGITCYPDGARSGQPLTPVPYNEAITQEGAELIEEAMNVCHLKSGSCGD